MRRVITYGTFDLLHYGHINLLRRAKALGDYLIVVISTDEFNWNEKHKKTYFSYEQRKELLEAIRYVDLVIPDISYLKKNINKVRGLVVTHGHEDHIGAIPYVINDLNIPIYGTKLTMALIEGKLKEHKITGINTNVVSFGDIIKLGNIHVEFIKTNHSIVDSAALAIYTSAGIIMHTGDFKVDYTPVFGDSIDLKHFAEIGKMGVLALLSDSTNATKPGFTMSERVVGQTFNSIFIIRACTTY